jgi:hypothetical protein
VHSADCDVQILCKDLPRLLAKDDSLVARRTPFAKHNLWVIADPEGDRLFPAGKFPTQTVDAPADSVSHWAAKGESVRSAPISVFLTWGTTHLPRPEDFRASAPACPAGAELTASSAIMPAEHLSLTLKVRFTPRKSWCRADRQPSPSPSLRRTPPSTCLQSKTPRADRRTPQRTDTP